MHKSNKQPLAGVLQKNGNNFDLLRIIAALAVIVGHGYVLAPQPPLQDYILLLLQFDYSGSLAVKFFFFLSGMLVTESIIKKPEPIKFLIRRVFRIFPGLIVCLLVTIFIIGPIYTKLTLHDYFMQKDTWTYLTNNIELFDLQWKIKSVIDDNKYGLNGSLWTLQYEMMCYLYIAIFCGVGIFYNRIAANLIFIGIVACAFLSPEYLPRFAQNPDSFLLPACFSIGALFSINKNMIFVDWQRAALLWLAVLLVNAQNFHVFLFYIAFFYTAVWIASREFVITKLKLRFDASYGVYVYGFVIQQCLHASFPQMGVNGNQFNSMLIALFLGCVSWYAIEKPSILLGARLTSDNFSIVALKQKLQTAITKFQLWLNRNDSNSLSSRGLELIILLLIAFAIHGLVLRYVFPGYYSPLWPNHSDHYLPVAIARSTDSFLNFFGEPRPVGMIFFSIIGHLGIRGSIAAIVLITLINCVLSAMLFRKVAGIELRLPFILAYCLYLFLLFSQVHFYGFYTQDGFAQLSYFFLILAAWVYVLFYVRLASLIYLPLFLLCLIGFLAKETYGFAAIGIAAGWLLYSWKNTLMRAALPLVSVVSALAVALGYSVLIKSVFISVSASEVEPSYKANFSPSSIFIEWMRYAREALTVPSLAVILFVVATIFFFPTKNRKAILIVAGSCLLAGMASWLPNSLLPNHHFTGYSWSGAYILYLPVILLSGFIAFDANKNEWLRFPSLLLIFCLINYSVRNLELYAVNEWLLVQEKTQRNLLNSLSELMDHGSVTGSEKILITGINFPFSPFAHPLVLGQYSKMQSAEFDVIDYAIQLKNKRQNRVRLISPNEVSLSDYTQIWLFASDGKLIKSISGPRESIEPFLGLTSKDLVLYPEVARTLGMDSDLAVSTDKLNDGYVLLECGNKFREYSQSVIALRFFEASKEKIPENPYVWFMTGLTLEDLGRFEEAKWNFEQAIKLDTAESNPAFKESLKKIERISEPKK